MLIEFLLYKCGVTGDEEREERLIKTTVQGFGKGREERREKETKETVILEKKRPSSC